MIRNKKILIFLLIISITFFGGINKVSARDDISCTYSLPFSGIKPSTGEYIIVDSNHPCYSNIGDTAAQNCTIDAYINSSGLTVDSDVEGHWYISLDTNYHYVDTFNEIYKFGKHNSDDGFMLFGAKENAFKYTSSWDFDGIDDMFDDAESSDGHIYLKSTDTVCPKYIKIKTITSALSDAYKIKLKNGAEEKASDSTQWDDIDNFYYGPAADDLDDAELVVYTASDISRDTYKNNLKNFNNVSTSSSDNNGIKINNYGDSLYDGMIIPLVSAAGNVDATANSKIIEEVTNDYRDIVIRAWIDLINKQLSGMKSNCGDEFGKYINLKNYKDDVPSDGVSDSKSYAFVKYATNGSNYNNKTLTKNDEGITSTCWNQRADYLRAYNSFRAFMYSIGATTAGEVNFEVDQSTNNVFAKSILKDNDIKNASNNIVFDWDSMVCFFKFVRYGVDDDNFSKCTSGNEAVDEKKECAQQVSSTSFLKDTFSKDKCAYKCFGDVSTIKNKTLSILSGSYNTNKVHNDDYNNCVKSLSECGGGTYSSYETKCKSLVSCDSCTAYTECMKSYTNDMTATSFNTCMDEKVPGFSKNSKNALDEATKAYEEAVSCYTVTETFNFEDAGLLRFDYEFKSYEPKCSDIKVFTGIYNILIILAPFILLIYASYDYFKAVSGGDEEKIKQAKKKAPKRIIAFVLLLVFPVILRWYVSTFGTNRANNTKYIKCVITNDKGENESSED